MKERVGVEKEKGENLKEDLGSIGKDTRKRWQIALEHERHCIF